MSIFLVGNKCDLAETRQVTQEAGRKLADTYGMPFYEVSAKDGTNIAELFEKIGREAYDKIKKLGEKVPSEKMKLH